MDVPDSPAGAKAAEIIAKPVSRRAVIKAGGLAVGAAGAASLLGVAGAAATSTSSSTRSDRTSAQADKTQLKLMSWFWNEPGRSDAWRAMVQKFHEEQSAIEIVETGWPWEQYAPNFLVQLQTGDIDADLVQSTPDLHLRQLKAGVVEPLDEVASTIGLDFTPGRDPAAPMSLSQGHDALVRDGHLYGLDAVTVNFGLLYNPLLFETGNVALPTTIDDWVAATTALTSRPDQFGLYSPHTLAAAPSFWFILQAWVLAHDGLWAEGSTPLLTSEPVVNTIKLFKTMFDAGFPKGADDPTATRLFADNKLAQWYIVSAAVGVLKAQSPELYPTLRSLAPPWPGQKSLTRIHPITINAASEKKDAAKTFLSWLYQPEHYQELLERSLDVIPAFPAGITDEYLDSLAWTEGYKAGVQVTPPEILGDFIFKNDEFGQIVITNTQEVLTGNKTAEEAMATAQEAALELADAGLA